MDRTFSRTIHQTRVAGAHQLPSLKERGLHSFLYHDFDEDKISI